ncbi:MULTISPECIES: hypothetical protein [Halorussus]|uniref:hypothetical protein n=1 Tax=Halorussus TaxID=1070314 RepID=UPI00209E3ADC|nr:hypothetical protein [Halorussus vallis]USZ77447.1 hypothetical protein NGM07_08965 [Halorussus vallis]
MNAPTEKLETASDSSNDPETRERAINELGTANDCARLVELARMDDIGERYREQALSSLAHPQCRTRLEALVEDRELPESLRERAETLLEETPEDAGAGP